MKSKKYVVSERVLKKLYKPAGCPIMVGLKDHCAFTYCKDCWLNALGAKEVKGEK